MIDPAPLTTPLPLRHVLLVDASGFIFRAFHAIQILTRPDGTPVNAVYGFITMLMKLLEDMQPDHIAVIFDSARKTFRNDIAPSYKANRTDPPDELVPQFELVREATRAFNLDCIELNGFEADDLIATYTKEALQAGADVTIVSSDKDLMQLVSDRVCMWDSIKNRKIGPEQVVEKFGVPPEKVVDVQSLAGDSTDNVPGVPGIGIKTAAQLIQEYGDLDTLLTRAIEIKQNKRRESLIEHADKARLSRELVRLRDDVPLTIPLTQLERRQPDLEHLERFLTEQGFKSILARLHSRHPKEKAPASAPSMTASPSESARPSTPAPSMSSPPIKARYELVQTVEALEQWVADAVQQGLVAIDTETTSLDQTQAELVGMSLCLQPGKACYIPLGHIAPGSTSPLDLLGHADSTAGQPRQIPFNTALDRLRPLLADSGVLKVGHNIKYDMVVLERYGVPVRPVDDSMLLSYVLEGGLHGHGMDELAQRYLGHTTITFKEVAGIGKSQVTFDQVPLDKALDYAAEDAEVTFRLHQMLKPRLIEEHLVAVYETLERPLIPVLTAMEQRGIKVDVPQLKQVSQEFAQRLHDLEQEIHRLAGKTFNVGSPKQLGEILFEDLKLGEGQKSKAGSYGTGADILESLAAQGHILPEKVLEWRHLEKLRSTYADALLHQINPHTNRVHTSYAMASAATGRLSSTDPNLQNIPIRTEEGRKIRKAFVAEPGHQLVSLDYSQIELRLLAHMADIPVLKQAFWDGQDIHALTASQVFGIPLDQLDSATRRKAKAINFGIIYGISPFGLARQLGIEQSEAASYIKTYFERYPGIQEYMERTKQFCREHGYVQTLFGRRCHVPGIHDKNPARRNFSERAAINAPLQGTAADILKRAMIRVPPALTQHGLMEKAHMLLTVHDELLFEVHESVIKETGSLIQTVMESATLPAVKLSIPLTVDVGQGHSWDAAH
ncbi:MAG: DNA polymerase I [Nitrospira sp.]|nr:DNA polymerase I [Nitrospira sp.]MCA9476063.1 DNA polymerase I [Nitrospira sp.]